MCSFQAERTEGQRATGYYQLSVPAFKELSYKPYPTTFAYVTLVRNESPSSPPRPAPVTEAMHFVMRQQNQNPLYKGERENEYWVGTGNLYHIIFNVVFFAAVTAVS